MHILYLDAYTLMTIGKLQFCGIMQATLASIATKESVRWCIANTKSIIVDIRSKQLDAQIVCACKLHIQQQKLSSQCKYNKALLNAKAAIKQHCTDCVVGKQLIYIGDNPLREQLT